LQADVGISPYNYDTIPVYSVGDDAYIVPQNIQKNVNITKIDFRELFTRKSIFKERNP